MAVDSPPIPPKSLSAATTERARVAWRTCYRILGLTFLVSFVMYLDRVCMGTVAPVIMQEFGLDKITMGWSVFRI